MSGPRVSSDEFGERTAFDAIEVGKDLGSYPWSFTEDEVDLYSMAHTEFHEWYNIESPFGGRVAPPSITYRFPRWRFAEVYWVRGLFVAWENEQLDVLRPGVEYVWSGRISDAYVKRDREWVWHEWECRTAKDGELVTRTRRGHVLDYLKRSDARIQSEQTLDDSPSEHADEAERYMAPRWNRDRPGPRELPISTGAPLAGLTAVGAELPPVSHQYTWRYSRDWYDLLALPSHSQAMREFNIHTDARAAAREGLDAPTTIGPLPASQISRMMLTSFGQGWLRGGSFRLRFIRQMGLDDFLTAKGTVVDVSDEDAGTRIQCEVWVENHRGTKTVVGSATALVARR